MFFVLSSFSRSLATTNGDFPYIYLLLRGGGEKKVRSGGGGTHKKSSLLRVGRKIHFLLRGNDAVSLIYFIFIFCSKTNLETRSISSRVKGEEERRRRRRRGNSFSGKKLNKAPYIIPPSTHTLTLRCENFRFQFWSSFSVGGARRSFLDFCLFFVRFGLGWERRGGDQLITAAPLSSSSPPSRPI